MIELDPVEVLSRFSVLSGLEDAERCLPLCGAAAREIGDSERGGCPETGREALNAAAAALAFYRWTLAGAGRGNNSFSAGDVKVSSGKSDPGAAKELWRNAAAAASPYLKDPGPFRFGRIRP